VSLHEYLAAKELRKLDPPFYGLIMAAMWGADTYNVMKLRAAFPDVWEELNIRYNAPGGLLPTESAA
jgi:hypothetical protein